MEDLRNKVMSLSLASQAIDKDGSVGTSLLDVDDDDEAKINFLDDDEDLSMLKAQKYLPATL